MRRIKSRRGLFGIVILFALMACEMGIRFSGAVDFPVYAKDAELGYIQRPNQSGNFLRKNRWAINDYSLFSYDKFEASRAPSIFLIGDSIVWCGNPYRYEDHLCVAVEQATGMKTWAAAAGSWSSWSEMGYMQRFPNVVSNASYLVWIFNSGDFDAPTVWQSELTHPTRVPLWATFYLACKYLSPWFSPESPPPPTKVDMRQLQNIQQFIARVSADKRKAIIFLWPTKEELLAGRQPPAYEQIRQGLSQVNSERIMFVDLARAGVLKPGLYRDGIHPNPQGVRVMADYIKTLVSPVR